MTLAALLLAVILATPAPVTGNATWYCQPGRSACTRGYPASGPYAAAGPALRVGNWRGRWVTVRANGRAIRVRLVDACQCGNGRRLIDLYGSQFARLAPLGRGVLRVSVTWEGR
jgi:rare lipoprotein A (peptidoglycan hydrolase)